MQIASNVSMWGGADHCTIKLQCTAYVRTLTYPLFLQWDIRQVLLFTTDRTDRTDRTDWLADTGCKTKTE